MEKTNELINKAMERNGIPSDYALAKVLGVYPSCISNYRSGLSYPGERQAMKLAELLQAEPGYVLATIQAQRTKNDDARKAWEKLADRRRCERPNPIERRRRQQ